MRKLLIRQLKFILFSSIIFYIGILLIGIIPYHFYDELFWEGNLFLRIFSGVLGISLIITIISNIYISFGYILPYRSKSNYILITNALLSLVVMDLVFSDPLGVSQSFAVIVFISVGILVILLNLVNLYLLKLESEEDLLENWKQGIISYKSENINYGGKIKLHDILLFIFVFSVFLDFTMDNYLDFILLVVIAIYVINNYYKLYNIDTKKIIVVIFAFILLFTLSIYVLMSYRIFLEQHSVLRALTIILPYSYIIFNILPDAYKHLWLGKDISLYS